MSEDNKKIYKAVIELCEEVMKMREEVATIKQNILPSKPNRGNWRDLVEWLREIPGAPQLTTRESIDCYCGPEKIFKPGEAYELHNRRRIFIRSEVERVIREWAKIDR